MLDSIGGMWSIVEVPLSQSFWHSASAMVIWSEGAWLETSFLLCPLNDLKIFSINFYPSSLKPQNKYYVNFYPSSLKPQNKYHVGSKIYLVPNILVGGCGPFPGHDRDQFSNFSASCSPPSPDTAIATSSSSQLWIVLAKGSTKNWSKLSKTRWNEDMFGW